MPSDILLNNNCELIENNQTIEISLLLENLKNSIWILGIPSWLFAITDRGVAAFADGYLSPIELLHLFTASFFFVTWLFLKPDESLKNDNAGSLHYHTYLNSYCPEAYLPTATRMFELQEQHMISQAYILPFPYLCQIYHLLNLKHLETIHSFSLNNLKVIDVSHFQATVNGGMLKFQTILAVSANVLRIWRQPIVEVELRLLTPFTVELSIPVYNEKKIIVVFNVLPLNTQAHKFFIDIYSDLKWPKPVLQIILHLASCLTLYEDLPYLRTLAQRNIDRLVSLNRVSNHESMWLFRRFVELYGSSIEQNELRLLSSLEDK
ncbi:hypothetical protein [Iningainema tapete]|uniref:Uncharacterized protein n=1 Tax=Iningainema tapete BLCC-T55 TaxID=2748662 RepID=A0A8J6XGI1_9CYAN|nr:hypothetical protein [Iningainema tapete]MBD2771566.1 hypothetical protein [Iningainema tapete BLCC-T55]